MNKIDALKKTELFGGLSTSQLNALAIVCVSRCLSKGLYVIAQGSLRAYRGNAEGREQIIHVEKAGTTIAEVPVFDDNPYPSTVMAEEDSEVLFISRENVKRLFLKHPEIALAAVKLLAGRLRKAAALAESLSLKEVDQRLAVYLLQEFTEKKGKSFTLPNNSVLAARLGSVREVVSRAFTRLETEGLISIDKKHQVSLKDTEGLRDRAEG